MIEEIRDYHPINHRLATSGQPTPEQFSEIAKAGYRAIINLALSTSTNAIENEGAIVTDLGMVYIQIPVVWDNPKVDDVKLFFKIMDLMDGDKPNGMASQRVWVHCAKNMRVSCFIYLWQKHILQLPEAEAKQPMERIWQPTGVWQQLIQQVERAIGESPLRPTT